MVVSLLWCVPGSIHGSVVDRKDGFLTKSHICVQFHYYHVRQVKPCHQFTGTLKTKCGKTVLTRYFSHLWTKWATATWERERGRVSLHRWEMFWHKTSGSKSVYKVLKSVLPESHTRFSIITFLWSPVIHSRHKVRMSAVFFLNENAKSMKT